jgi:acetoin utilization protein AcuB
VHPKTLTVAQYMTSDPVTLDPDDTLMHALEVMRLRGVRRVPIVVGTRLVGLLVEGDLKRAEPSPLDESQEEFERVMEGTSVARIMIQNPMTVTADLPLLEAAKILHRTKYGALPVVAGDQLIGIVTDNDLLRAFIEVAGDLPSDQSR